MRRGVGSRRGPRGKAPLLRFLLRGCVKGGHWRPADVNLLESCRDWEGQAAKRSALHIPPCPTQPRARVPLQQQPAPKPLGAMRASPACKGPGSAACTFQCRLRAAWPAALQPRPSRCSAARATPTHCSASFVSEEPSTSGRLADREQRFNGSGPQSSSGGRPTDGAGRPWRSGNTPTGWHPLAQPLIWQVGACGILLHWSGLGLCCAQWGRAFQVGPRPCWAPQQCCCSE